MGNLGGLDSLAALLGGGVQLGNLLLKRGDKCNGCGNLGAGLERAEEEVDDSQLSQTAARVQPVQGCSLVADPARVDAVFDTGEDLLNDTGLVLLEGGN